jgi:hypothetical protein
VSENRQNWGVRDLRSRFRFLHGVRDRGSRDGRLGRVLHDGVHIFGPDDNLRGNVL